MAPEVIDLGRFCSSHHYCPFRTAPLAGALHALTLMRVITVFDGLLVAQIEGRDGTGHKAVPDMVGGKCRAGGRAPRPPALGHRRAMPTLPTDPATMRDVWCGADYTEVESDRADSWEPFPVSASRRV